MLRLLSDTLPCRISSELLKPTFAFAPWPEFNPAVGVGSDLDSRDDQVE